MQTNHILEMAGIHKKFGRVNALTDASFTLKNGEVHALLGANGAGKSTLMKILSGLYKQDDGDLFIDGEKVSFNHPKDAKENGVYCVYQEVDTAIVPELSTAENIMLDTFASGKNIWVSKRKLEEKAKEVLFALQAGHINVRKQALELTLAEKQLVLIARALVHSAKLIIFDEPTAPLSVFEAERLFKVMNQLKDQGVGCIFITHRLPEVFEVCDTVTVMRDGKHVFFAKVEETNQEQLVEKMLGTSFENVIERREKKLGEQLIECTNLKEGRKLNGINFAVHKGEIIGVAGLVGAGKTELAKTIAGVTPASSGTIKIKGKKVTIYHPQAAIEQGVVLVPEERRKEGLFIHESLRKNATFPNLKKFSKASFIRKNEETNFALKMIGALQIKTNSTETTLNHLSGGNQQKVAIGKWMSVDASIYLFDEPTKGVDIGAKKDIFKLIADLANEGKGVIYFSSEIHELLAICDRILVMYDGQVVKEFSHEEATQEKILLYASGGKEEQNEREKHPVLI
ncbi:sugar ABC transporter ATP-binding protein [Cytobacillus purgationiresistens]|uniref:Simple sugar transport system ATP-binding protein n=1 Tax=Cytobacillus purgationiresistens TaxID=863449 RepID=A0ABU0APK0_9BACI|nr:sugar ABC transporter ATP-binding protein [Cytobacillus purgationiresistens]MDQ0272794.1 simple sugar transport system ATP-binding protein [Cytobacillus purgationiresistens]